MKNKEVGEHQKHLEMKETEYSYITYKERVHIYIYMYVGR